MSFGSGCSLDRLKNSLKECLFSDFGVLSALSTSPFAERERFHLNGMAQSEEVIIILVVEGADVHDEVMSSCRSGPV